jgi:hypothetical protein
MLGQRLNLLFIILAGLVFQSCGKRPQVEGAPHFIPGQILLEGNGSELSVDRRLTRTWKDYDGDGIPDRKDPDIDNDGVANIADQFPFDGTKTGEDQDQDGIMDFVDLSFSADPQARALADLQEEIFKKLGVTVINGSDNFTEAEWLAMHQTLFHEVMMAKLKYTQLLTIVRYSKKDQLGETRADFDPFWLQLSFYPNASHQNNVLAFAGSLIHELGHVHAYENPTKFEQFKQDLSLKLITLPSQYATTSVDEAYAEVFALECYMTGMDLDPKRFDLLKEERPSLLPSPQTLKNDSYL